MQLSNKTYDFLNALVRVVLPAFATLYFTLSEIWGMPWASEIVGTSAAVALFGGLVIKLARNGWVETTDGTLVIDDTDEQLSSFGFEGGKMLHDFNDKQIVKLKVDRTYYQPTFEDEAE